jgi:hypothetical protein
MVELHELVRLGNDLDWAVLAKKAHDYRCGALVYAALHAAQAVLGSDLPEAGLRTLRPRALRRRALELVNRQALPASVCLPRASGGSVHAPGRRASDVLRRFLALDATQRVRFLWHRVVVPRITRARI